MSGPFVGHSDSKLAPAPTTIAQPPPGYQNPQPAIYVQQQHPSVMANQPPMLQPQGTGATQQTYPPQPTQPMMNPMNPYSPTQPAMQLYPPIQPNPALMQNPPTIQQPQYMQAPLTPAQAGELYRTQLYARCANGQHEWTTTYGPAGIITAIICFPIGLLALLIDKKRVCMRCQASVPY